MASQEVQTADGQARVTLPAAFAETTVIVEMLSASEVRIRKVDETGERNMGSDDLMRLADASGAFDFWNDPAEDIYGPDDGELV
jgi:hypothetical protein